MDLLFLHSDFVDSDLMIELAFQIIMLTFTCNADSLTPHFHIVKLGFTRVFIFPYFCSKIDCGYSLEP